MLSSCCLLCVTGAPAAGENEGEEKDNAGDANGSGEGMGRLHDLAYAATGAPYI